MGGRQVAGDRELAPGGVDELAPEAQEIVERGGRPPPAAGVKEAGSHVGQHRPSRLGEPADGGGVEQPAATALAAVGIGGWAAVRRRR
jgi:hypothetical protein